MRGLYPVSLACEVLEVSASGYFNWLRRRQASRSGPSGRHSDEALLAHIRAIHAEVKGEYGWPRMHKELLARGIRVGKDRVRKLMKQHGIKAKTKRKFVVTTDSRHNLPVAPDLVQRRFNPRGPTSSGVATSPTSPRTRLAVPGRCHRPVWPPGGGLEPSAPHANQSGQGRIGHGVVASAACGWLDIPQRQGQSILQRGVPGHFESLGHALIDEQKGELLGQRANGELLGSAENGQCAWSKFATREQARQAVMDWMAFYNHRRLHSSLGYLSPMQFEQRWYEAQRKKPRDHWAKNYTEQGQGQIE